MRAGKFIKRGLPSSHWTIVFMPIAVGYRLTAQCVRRTGQTKIRPQHVGRPVHLFGEKTGAPSKHDHLIFHGAGVPDTFAQIHQAVSLINADWRNWDLDIQNCLAGRRIHHFLLDFRLSRRCSGLEGKRFAFSAALGAVGFGLGWIQKSPPLWVETVRTWIVILAVPKAEF